MVVTWLRQHPAAAASDEEDHWVNSTFERFWREAAAAEHAEPSGATDGGNDISTVNECEV